MENAVCEFAEKPVNAWSALLNVRRELNDDWVFRGQPSDKPLRTSLDRALTAYGIPHDEAPGIEEQLIRDFRRRYDGPGSDLVAKDSLYCLALMQHHGAPTRLLDVTYSFFVACLFAIDSLEPPNGKAVIWCVRKGWTLDASRAKVGKVIDDRNVDAKRDEESFRQIYVESQQAIVFHENPFRLNQRLIIQQGGFLCPGDIRSDFEANVKGLDRWNSGGNVLKVILDLSAPLRQEAMEDLLRMNVSRASLFPGLDGFAGSIAQRLPLLRSLASMGTGRGAT
jgi:hypothetical protein